MPVRMCQGSNTGPVGECECLTADSGERLCEVLAAEVSMRRDRGNALSAGKMEFCSGPLQACPINPCIFWG